MWPALCQVHKPCWYYINFYNCNDLVTGPVGKPAWPVQRKYMITSWNSLSGVHAFLKVGGMPGLGHSCVKLNACYSSRSSNCGSGPCIPGLPRLTLGTWVSWGGQPPPLYCQHSWLLKSVRATRLICPTPADGCYPCLSPRDLWHQRSTAMFTVWMLPAPLLGPTFSAPPREARL